jgi:hypothetical protein
VRQQDIQDAVDEQMQKHWKSVNGTSFDSDEELDSKQGRLDEIARWVTTISDRQQRKAYDYWVSVAQYTITRVREERKRKAAAQRLINTDLPALPF